MRVLLVTHYYFPDRKSTAKLMHDLAVEFRRQGHEVIVATPSPDLDAPMEVTEEEGVSVLRVRSGRFDGVSTVRRGWNECRLVADNWRLASEFFRARPCQLLVWWTPSLFWARLVERLKRLWNCTTYLLVRDVIPKWWVDCGVIRKGGLTHRIFRRLERRQYEVADVIAVQSPANMRYFEEEGLADRHRFDVLYNWTRTEGEPFHPSRLRRELGAEDKVVFFYGGNLGRAQDAACIVRLAEALRDEPRAFFLAVGYGSDVPRMEAMIREKALDNIALWPAVDQQTYLGMVREADVGLITLARGHNTQNFPGKMLGYIYFSKPVLAAINPGNDLGDLLSSSRAGFSCVNGEDEKLRNFALRLLREPQLRRTMGENGRRMLEEVFAVGRAVRQILTHVPEQPGPARRREPEETSVGANV